MNILVAGRLGRYADRILALQRLGHHLIYCTMPAPHQKPLPDVLGDDSILRYSLEKGAAAQAAVRSIVREHDVEVIYSIKNVWDGSLELLEDVLDADLGVPIVRHYKEHFCEPSEIERRSLTETNAQIYINDESLDYFVETYGVSRQTAHILDTDYLPARYVDDELAPPLFDETGRPSVLYAGGLSDDGGRSDVREIVSRLARSGVIVHLFGRKYVGRDERGVVHTGHRSSQRAYEQLEQHGVVELHDHIEPAAFVRRWSRYDVGLMHAARPGTDRFARFNHPNRVAPYIAAGLPLAQQGTEHVALRRLIEERSIGINFEDPDELAELLHDRPALDHLKANVLGQRHEFTFEHHAPTLARILRSVVDGTAP